MKRTFRFDDLIYLSADNRTYSVKNQVALLDLDLILCNSEFFHSGTFENVTLCLFWYPLD